MEASEATIIEEEEALTVRIKAAGSTSLEASSIEEIVETGVAIMAARVAITTEMVATSMAGDEEEAVISKIAGTTIIEVVAVVETTEVVATKTTLGDEMLKLLETRLTVSSSFSTQIKQISGVAIEEEVKEIVKEVEETMAEAEAPMIEAAIEEATRNEEATVEVAAEINRIDTAGAGKISKHLVKQRCQLIKESQKMRLYESTSIWFSKQGVHSHDVTMMSHFHPSPLFAIGIYC